MDVNQHLLTFRQNYLKLQFISSSFSLRLCVFGWKVNTLPINYRTYLQKTIMMYFMYISGFSSTFFLVQYKKYNSSNIKICFSAPHFLSLFLIVFYSPWINTGKLESKSLQSLNFFHHSHVGRSAEGGTQTEGTVSPNMDPPRPLNNIFIFFPTEI